jgi:hypothetical protein
MGDVREATGFPGARPKGQEHLARFHPSGNPRSPHPGGSTTLPVNIWARNPVTAGSVRCRTSRSYAESQKRCHPGVIPEGPRASFELPCSRHSHDHPSHSPSPYFCEPRNVILLTSETRERPWGGPPISTCVRDTFPAPPGPPELAVTHLKSPGRTDHTINSTVGEWAVPRGLADGAKVMGYGLEEGCCEVPPEVGFHEVAFRSGVRWGFSAREDLSAAHHVVALICGIAAFEPSLCMPVIADGSPYQHEHVSFAAPQTAGVEVPETPLDGSAPAWSSRCPKHR